MGFYTTELQSSFCAVLGRQIEACAPWWDRAANAENLITGIIAISSALLGAVVGGYISHRSQMSGLRYQRDRFNEEQNRQLKDRIIMFLMTTVRIKADMENVQNRIDYYRKTSLPGAKLWEAVHFILVVQALEPELSYLDPIARLNSSKLLTDSMWIYSEYLSVMSTLSQYNEIRTTYIDLRRSRDPDLETLGKIEKNMAVHVEFIAENSRFLIDQADAVQRLLFSVCERNFGDADFLRLGDPKIG